jgi:uncharacterized protein (DUF433 family)
MKDMIPSEIPAELDGILVRTEDTLGGAIRFVGTRVPVQALIDTIAAGKGLEDFLEGFPNVRRDHALAVLNWEQLEMKRLLGIERAS